MNTKILDKIRSATKNINNPDFIDTMDTFIKNISNIELKTIPEFIPCDKKLYITRPKMREEIRKLLKPKLHKFFKEIGHENYTEINGCTFRKFENIIEETVKILVKKQQGKI